MMEKIHTFENNGEEERVKEIGMLAKKVFEKIENWDNSDVYALLTKLKEKYPDHTNYRLYHLLDSSSLGPDSIVKKCSKFDFPGDDSVEKFLRSQNI